MGKPRLALFYTGMIVIVCSITYASLEVAARKFDLPDPGLIRNMENELAAADTVEGYFSSEAPIYGWDQDVISCSSANRESDSADPLYTILFVGDSVTRGHGVDVETESYPMLLCRTAPEGRSLRILNEAVPGYGVDQMMLKLETLVPEYRPDLIVFAYIPHDLWRPASNVSYGYTKPVLIADGSGGWEIIPTQSSADFYEAYEKARSGYYLGLWSLNHLVVNRRYYFPRLYASYYRDLFQGIRNRLIELAERYDAAVLVVRLASTWPGDAVPFLDRMAAGIFSAPADTETYRYFDSERCVRARSRALGIKYNREFQYHPSPRGHEIYAGCLVETV